MRHGYQWEQRSFLAALVRLTDEGFSRLVIISLEDEPALGVQLKELMTRSGITDTDIVVSYVEPQALSITSLASRQARLHLLVDGSPVAVPEVAPGEVNSLVSAINQGLEQASALANRLF